MFPYKTNSADYLDYVASAMTREEILADPKFCSLLENPYIKENMEVALAWHKAKFGDYQDKYEFVEYYLCNGPELDADTLLHYRALAQADPVCMEIAYSYFDDTEVLSEIRETKYGKKKKSSWDDCFTNPCNYLGDFSGVMGSMGDYKNVESHFATIGNKFAAWMSPDKKKEKAIEAATARGEYEGNLLSGFVDGITSLFDFSDEKTIKPQGSEKKIETSENSSGQSAGSAAYSLKLRPSYEVGWARLGKSIIDSDTEFANNLMAKASPLHMPKFGDWFGSALSETVAMLDKAHTIRYLGDCHRMWSQVRRLKIFGSDNKYSPITQDLVVGNKNPDGTPANPVNVTHPLPTQSTPGIQPDAVQKATENKDKN